MIPDSIKNKSFTYIKTHSRVFCVKNTNSIPKISQYYIYPVTVLVYFSISLTKTFQISPNECVIYQHVAHSNKTKWLRSSFFFTVQSLSNKTKKRMYIDRINIKNVCYFIQIIYRNF